LETAKIYAPIGSLYVIVIFDHDMNGRIEADFTLQRSNLYPLA